MEREGRLLFRSFSSSFSLSSSLSWLGAIFTSPDCTLLLCGTSPIWHNWGF